MKSRTAQDALDSTRYQAQAFSPFQVLGFEIPDARGRRGVAGLELGKDCVLVKTGKALCEVG